MADVFHLGIATSLKMRAPAAETGLTPLMADHVKLALDQDFE